LLVSGVVDKQVKLWDVTTKANERDLGSTAQDWSLLEFSRDGRLLAMSEGYTVKLWDVATGHELPALRAPNSGFFSTQGRVFVGFADDGKKVATGGFDTPTILWETDTAKQLLKLSGHTNMAYKVAFSADGNQLFSGGRTRWDLRTGRGVRLTAAPSDNQFGVPSPDGRLLALFAPNSNAVTILETPSGRQLQTLAPSTSEVVVQRVNFSPDSALLVVTYMASEAQMRKPRTPGQFGSNENQVKIWHVKSGRELHTLTLANAQAKLALVLTAAYWLRWDRWVRSRCGTRRQAASCAT
jgi:WD40 repeat protein